MISFLLSSLIPHFRTFRVAGGGHNSLLINRLSRRSHSLIDSRKSGRRAIHFFTTHSVAGVAFIKRPLDGSVCAARLKRQRSSAVDRQYSMVGAAMMADGEAVRRCQMFIFLAGGRRHWRPLLFGPRRPTTPPYLPLFPFRHLRRALRGEE